MAPRKKFYCLDPVENERRYQAGLKANKKRRNKKYWPKYGTKRRKKQLAEAKANGTYQEILRDQVVITIGIDTCKEY